MLITLKTLVNLKIVKKKKRKYIVSSINSNWNRELPGFNLLVQPKTGRSLVSKLVLCVFLVLFCVCFKAANTNNILLESRDCLVRSNHNRLDEPSLQVREDGQCALQSLWAGLPRNATAWAWPSSCGDGQWQEHCASDCGSGCRPGLPMEQPSHPQHQRQHYSIAGCCVTQPCWHQYGRFAQL